MVCGDFGNILIGLCSGGIELAIDPFTGFSDRHHHLARGPDDGLRDPPAGRFLQEYVDYLAMKLELLRPLKVNGRHYGRGDVIDASGGMAGHSASPCHVGDPLACGPRARCRYGYATDLLGVCEKRLAQDLMARQGNGPGAAPLSPRPEPLCE